MHLFSFLLCISLGALVKGETGSDWCYTGCNTTPEKWADLPESSCGSDRQSPISIVTNLVETNYYLDNFAFTNFDNHYINKSIINTGHTVKINLMEEGVEVTGGGLSGTYSTIQFHFHWSSEEHNQGSEHMIDGHRYAMEMHIVSLKKGLTVEEAVQDSEGIAVLAFFINATEDDENMSGPWSNLTSYLTDMERGAAVDISNHFSINDLIGNVNLTKFYRYMGSLTTPNCSEAVVWTVFKEPINVSKNLIKKFPMETKLTNNYRPTQHLNERRVFASPATTLPPSPPWCYDEHCNYQPSNWHVLPYSHCDGESQSPINIETNTVIDKNLGDFSFTGFENKKAIAKITNTGHTVECILHDNVVEVSEGGLGYVYSTIQFYFHWGSQDSNGSEHTVDSHRYPMEMHIVNKRKGLTVDEAVEIPDLAVLGFFIEATDTAKSSVNSEQQTNPEPSMDAWNKLAKYLENITRVGAEVEFTEEISIDDLLGNVNRKEYYRYNGSLTTPSCNEAVVWTVFKESIKVDNNLMMMFPTKTEYTKVFRPAQSLNGRTIFRSASSAPAPIILFLLLACFCAFLI